MDLLAIFIFICLPITLLVTLFIGIVKKNKRLWITSLIFFIVFILLEFLFLFPVSKTHFESNKQTHTLMIK